MICHDCEGIARVPGLDTQAFCVKGRVLLCSHGLCRVNATVTRVPKTVTSPRTGHLCFLILTILDWEMEAYSAIVSACLPAWSASDVSPEQVPCAQPGVGIGPHTTLGLKHPPYALVREATQSDLASETQGRTCHSRRRHGPMTAHRKKAIGFQKVTKYSMRDLGSLQRGTRWQSKPQNIFPK